MSYNYHKSDMAYTMKMNKNLKSMELETIRYKNVHVFHKFLKYFLVFFLCVCVFDMEREEALFPLFPPFELYK